MGTKNYLHASFSYKFYKQTGLISWKYKIIFTIFACKFLMLVRHARTSHKLSTPEKILTDSDKSLQMIISFEQKKNSLLPHALATEIKEKFEIPNKKGIWKIYINWKSFSLYAKAFKTFNILCLKKRFFQLECVYVWGWIFGLMMKLTFL